LFPLVPGVGHLLTDLLRQLLELLFIVGDADLEDLVDLGLDCLGGGALVVRGEEVLGAVEKFVQLLVGAVG